MTDNGRWTWNNSVRTPTNSERRRKKCEWALEKSWRTNEKSAGRDIKVREWMKNAGGSGTFDDGGRR
jgi:hypothetical protein